MQLHIRSVIIQNIDSLLSLNSLAAQIC